MDKKNHTYKKPVSSFTDRLPFPFNESVQYPITVFTLAPDLLTFLSDENAFAK
ncbi:hypothetical protein J2S09_000392 [Bacillus fengqiuensis]|nr:hypothetical protein [Bacillus fengqiuensis]